jgi:mRNA-degrading endonuclease toxin of MazEF toxin-antitoxin module
MQISGDIVNLDLGRPEGREAGYLHPAVVVTAQRILDATRERADIVLDGARPIERFRTDRQASSHL